ncbi:MerR family transcriptional regulator [Janthinobacterium svalbardensis]|uniref:MerR family transcriptional regulator n=1 Tax=Janthinobacterium svalbardensis TaxID=368607 RepID=UPI001FC9F08E|nr:MerR family transcriptional regulator [Janthinobacterium svalbardensis]
MQPLHPPSAFSISDVERDTGLAKETLRVWERRYAFPQPQRDAFGERSYPAEQVQKLRMVKRLLDLGFRPGKIMQHSTVQLQQLASAGSAAPSTRAPQLEHYLALCRGHQMAELGDALRQALAVLGLKAFTIDVIAPLTGMVGEAWACGDLAIYEEHLYSETLQTVMRHAIFSLPQASSPSTRTPRIVLSTLPQERHGLGLLMAEALCAAAGAHCMSLGWKRRWQTSSRPPARSVPTSWHCRFPAPASNGRRATACSSCMQACRQTWNCGLADAVPCSTSSRRRSCMCWTCGKSRKASPTGAAAIRRWPCKPIDPAGKRGNCGDLRG